MPRKRTTVNYKIVPVTDGWRCTCSALPGHSVTERTSQEAMEVMQEAVKDCIEERQHWRGKCPQDCSRCKETTNNH